MNGLENFSFATPWALSALILLPVIWQVLKATPPKPTLVKFPAVRLLQELKSERIVAAKTPWWLLLLRSLILLALIFAMAQPILNQNMLNIGNTSHIVLLIDNDWSVMDRWQDRQKEMDRILLKAGETDKTVMLVPTADLTPLSFQPAQDARKVAKTLQPRPWTTDRTKRFEQVKTALSELQQPITFFWISNGLAEQESDPEHLTDLSQWGDMTYVHGSEETLPGVIKKVTRTAQGLHVTLNRAGGGETIQLLDSNSNVLFSRHVKPDQSDSLNIELPGELKSRVESLRLSGSSTPASQFLLDERWRDKPVGIIQADAVQNDLLDPAYYIRKALLPYAPVRQDRLEKLLVRKSAVIIDLGTAQRTVQQQDQLEQWVKSGGILLQFASSRYGAQHTAYRHNLMPAPLTQSERTLGGTLSWKRPAKLTSFPPHSPFRNLPVPKDITINKQVLAQPDAQLEQHAWARLQDGTPLITARAIDDGWSVMFHVTATPDWSSLPLSGTFEQMLVRLLGLSSGSALDANDQPLNAFMIFNSFGTLIPAQGNAEPIAASMFEQTRPGPDHPPGLYGPSNALRALNLGPHLAPLTPLPLASLEATKRGFESAQETRLAPWVLLAALMLALTDWLISLTWLRQRSAVVATLILTFLLCVPAHGESDLDMDKALAAANHMRLAYMVTHDDKLDDDVRRGLDSLAAVLRRRTAVELAPTMAYDPEKDDPSLFPMIYWPIGERQERLSDQAVDKLNSFLNKGGFLLMDTMGRVHHRRLRELTADINIGPLQTVKANHVLTRSFYLMNKFPGRYNHPDVWVEADADSSRDRVSSVLIGSNAWAQSWARDPSLRPIYPTVPGGEIQREQSYRFGVNLVMYILSGNYKGDQVHLPAILQRLGL